ncbi:probable solute carrier family 35 member F6 at N-terminal half [Coccomyxa sp. Obi]|nr:probable solute carrier family 35 member F6 at N-terminal half [Coccomyxa sp. Obi]
MSIIIAVTGLGISSTGSALLRKVLFQLKAEGEGGDVHTFEKPWFTTFESALACLVSLLLYTVYQYLAQCWHWRNAQQLTASQTPLLEGNGDDTLKEVVPCRRKSSWKELLMLAWPGTLNIMSIIVQGMGLQYISASVSQMISGSCIIFTAALSVMVLGRRLNWLHITGIVLTLVAVVIVSLVNVFYPPSPCPRSDPACMSAHGPDHHSSSDHILLGIMLTFAAQAFQAVRLVMEELLLEKMVLHHMEVLGWEGLWGTLVMGIIGMPLAWFLPGADIGGREENTLDSLLMLWNDDALNAVNMLFFWSVVGLNVFGLMVTQVLGSVFRAVMLTARTASVWAVDLLLYGMLPPDLNVGEAWVSPASWIQLLGFSLLLAGTIIYAQGSSPAAHAKDVAEADAAAEIESVDTGRSEPGPPGPGQKRQGIANIRPLYSIYIPQSRTETAAPVLIPGATLDRTTSLPTTPERVYEPPVVDEAGAQSSLPNYLRGRLPTRGSLLSLLRPTTSHDNESISSADGELPAGASPSFVRTLTHRSSWILDRAPEDIMGGSRASSGDLEAWPSGANSGANPFAAAMAREDLRSQPILEDDGRPSIDTRRSSHAGEAEEDPSRRRHSEERQIISKQGSRGVRWSDEEDVDLKRTASAGERNILGQSPTAEVLLERRASQRLPIVAQPTIAENEEDDGGDSVEDEGQAAFRGLSGGVFGDLN